MELVPILAVPIGYLLGSIPSAYIIGRFFGVDLRHEGRGHVSATAVYRRIGNFPFVIAVLMDGAKGALAILVAQVLGGSLLIILATGLLAAVGHCWSIFIKFNGGLGAVVSYSVLLTLLPLQFVAGMAAGAITFLLVRRSFLSTMVWLMVISLAALISGKDLILSLYPLCFILLQLARRYPGRRGGDAYSEELYHDLRRDKSEG